MKNRVQNANFPKTEDGRVYHLGIRAGEVANRIITVGSMPRAESIGKMLDASPKLFSLYSERGFLTITGCYKSVPVSIVCIGMGAPNVDFFIREIRECLSGDMLVIRLGSCGCLTDLPVGSLVLPASSVACTRNVDFDFVSGDPWGVPYRLSKPVSADPDLHSALRDALEITRPPSLKNLVVSNAVNASTDSFYSSQGRQTSFQDHNASLIDHLKAAVSGITTLEMETFWIFHLAASWRGVKQSSSAVNPPPATVPVVPAFSGIPSRTSENVEVLLPSLVGNTSSRPVIRAAAAQMVFASRSSQAFISPDQVNELEKWSGRGVLEALTKFGVAPERLHPISGSVWGPIESSNPLRALL
ncbi:purine and uridine phosphorylase [Suillus fuscotomentosus]|uniref:Purine and uridine phosphorylase n=1 Tax=Suillus fuscotomentosus TaxID=1912939 RepID=A0AAD4E2W4_9AGAM|nr:purine and uridine phosphorylase [Suillus fuscotomentosus]KAG1898686.1 purine and uridine phosphorylase [Suillus fuscotomentosus]